MNFEKPPIMTIESLISYGFKEYKPNQHDKFDRVFQYCKRDKIGKKFFVNVRFWMFSKYSRSDQVANDSFDASCQFDMRKEKTFDVTISVNDMTPSQVVDWFAEMFVLKNCAYYEKYAYDENEEQVSFNCNECGRYLPT